jgi:hypothetical protein
MNEPFRALMRASRSSALLLLASLSAGGCQLYHNLGSGEHYDAPPEHKLTERSTKVLDMIVEVTTDANRNVIAITFKRSSGRESIDEYVAQSIRTSFPGAPSTVSLVELTYSGLNGFSEPKLLSSHPAPANLR